MNNFMKLWEKITIFILLILSILSVFSLVKGIENALSENGSQDFQCSPTILFLEKINPYEYFLSGNIDKKIILWQFPVYSHLTYISERDKKEFHFIFNYFGQCVLIKK